MADLAWPLMAQMTGTNVVYTNTTNPATYTSASSILNPVKS